MTPLIKSHTLGHPFVPPPDHAGGLRYHAMAPLISHLKELGELEAVAYGQTECFEAGVLFAQAEGILPAPEVCVYLFAQAIIQKRHPGDPWIMVAPKCWCADVGTGAYLQYVLYVQLSRPTTLSRAPLPRRCAVRLRTRPRSFSSTSAGTEISIWLPMTSSTRVRWWTQNSTTQRYNTNTHKHTHTHTHRQRERERERERL